jgi:hypothetical protein
MFLFHEIFCSNNNSYEVLKVAFLKARLLEEYCSDVATKDYPVITNSYVILYFHITNLKITMVCVMRSKANFTSRFNKCSCNKQH